MVLLVAVVWTLVVVLTVLPLFAQSEGRPDWFWIVAVLVAGPLAGLAYVVSRYGQRRGVERAQVAGRRGESVSGRAEVG